MKTLAVRSYSSEYYGSWRVAVISSTFAWICWCNQHNEFLRYLQYQFNIYALNIIYCFTLREERYHCYDRPFNVLSQHVWCSLRDVACTMQSTIIVCAATDIHPSTTCPEYGNYLSILSSTAGIFYWLAWFEVIFCIIEKGYYILIIKAVCSFNSCLAHATN